MADLIYHGHATWEVQGETHRLLMDPFLTDNPSADVGPDHFDKLDAILVTHGHGDHIGDVVTIAKQTGALVVGNKEIADYFGEKGCETHPLHIGGAREFPFGKVKLTVAPHGSTAPDGTSLGCAAGIILTIDGKKIYNAGDTGLTLDMQLIPELWGPIDVAIFPIGDNFTMGIDDAVVAAEFVGAKTNIAQHFNTWPYIEVDVQDWVGKMKAAGHDAVVLEPGQTHTIA